MNFLTSRNLVIGIIILLGLLIIPPLIPIFLALFAVILTGLAIVALVSLLGFASSLIIEKLHLNRNVKQTASPSQEDAIDAEYTEEPQPKAADNSGKGKDKSQEPPDVIYQEYKTR